MTDFSLAQVRRIVADLFEPQVRVYAVDYGLSITIGHLLFLGVAFLPLGLPEPAWLLWSLRAVGFVIYCLLYYRCAMFIHELVHLRDDRFFTFRLFWNWFCGCTFLMPTFVYYTHLDHHRRRHFGTQRDGEYMPLACRPRWETVVYLLQPLVIPPLAFFRFLVLSPLKWLIPPLGRLIHQRASSMVMDPTYIRPLPTKGLLRAIWIQEAVCFLWCLFVVVAVTTFLRPWAVTLLVQGYLTAVVIIFLNAVRTLGAHRYYNAGEEMTFVEQMLDSVNYPRGLFTEFWAPTGTRYHALHHLLPALPYHVLPEAHRRLMSELPEDSPYRQTEEASLWTAIRLLWRRAGENGRRAAAAGPADAAQQETAGGA